MLSGAMMAVMVLLVVRLREGAGAGAMVVVLLLCWSCADHGRPSPFISLLRSSHHDVVSRAKIQ